MTYMAQRVANFGTTIFTEMTALANELNAINLGQGFPDFAAPYFIKDAAIKAIHADVNQYAPANGRPRLRQALAKKNRLGSRTNCRPRRRDYRHAWGNRSPLCHHHGVG